MCTMRDDATWQTKRYEEKEENEENLFLRNENFRSFFKEDSPEP